MFVRNLEESHIQQALIKWARYHRQKYPELNLLHAIPNGAHTTDKNRCRLISEGLLPGVLDLFLPLARHGYHGLYLETKTEKGKVSDEQRDFIINAFEQDFCCLVYHSWKQGVEYLLWYLENPITT